MDIPACRAAALCGAGGVERLEPKQLPGDPHAQDLLTPVRKVGHELHLAGAQQEKMLARFALAEEDFARPMGLPGQQAADLAGMLACRPGSQTRLAKDAFADLTRAAVHGQGSG